MTFASWLPPGLRRALAKAIPLLVVGGTTYLAMEVIASPDLPLALQTVVFLLLAGFILVGGVLAG